MQEWTTTQSKHQKVRGVMVPEGKEKKRPGPDPDRLHVQGDWKEALRRTVQQGDRKKPQPDEPDDGEKGEGVDG